MDGNNVTVTSYIPGNSYTAKWIVTAAQPIKGFQGVALTSTNAQAGTFTTILSTQSTISTLGGRQYPEHQGSSGSGLFNFTWVAPAQGTGNVTFYSCGNGVNGNGGTPGDKPSLPISQLVTEAPSTLISYADTNYCADGIDPTPTITGSLPGTFSAQPTGLSLNASAGTIDLSASTPGGYIVSYNFIGGVSSDTVYVGATHQIFNTATICDNDSIFLAGAWQNTQAIYTSNLQTADGCDSIVVTTLTVQSASSSQNTVSICQGEAVVIHGSFQTNAGVYVGTYSNSVGCDSIVSTTLIVNPKYSNPISETICQNDSTLFDGTWLTASGSYIDSSQTVTGCDSITTLTLSVTAINTGVTAAGPSLTAQQNGATYQWLECNASYSPIIGATSQNFTSTVNGSFAVEITFSNCLDTGTCYIVAGFGLNELSFGEIKLYPNPSKGKFSMTFSEKVSAKLNLMDLNGKILFTDELKGTYHYKQDFDFVPGTYIVQLEDEKVRMQMLWVVE
ncbi:MAG: T9SS type A sorting domain-containing protein [Crocinitomicaceae bacterium]|nr:T9SS type A sorting domain-containing protein [Crocinitomicaceae bacterium]